MENNYYFILDYLKREMNFPFQPRSFGYLLNNFHPPHKKPRTTIIVGFILRTSGTYRIVDPEYNTVHTPTAPWLSMSLPGNRSWSEASGPWDEIFFEYPESVADKLLETGLDIHRRRIEFVITKRFERLMDDFLDICRNIHRTGSVDRLDIVAYQMIVEASLPRSNAGLLHIENSAIQNIAAYIQENFMNEIDLERLLRNFGISRRTFYREWNKEFEISVQHYILRLKLMHARELIRSTDKKIYEIADECGFSSSMDFCRTFHRNFDQTPSAYRKKFPVIS